MAKKVDKKRSKASTKKAPAKTAAAKKRGKRGSSSKRAKRSSASSGILGRIAKGVGEVLQNAAKGAAQGAVAAVAPRSARKPAEESLPPASGAKKR